MRGTVLLLVVMALLVPIAAVHTQGQTQATQVVNGAVVPA